MWFNRCYSPCVGRIWGRDCWAWWHTQHGWSVESQLHHLHHLQVLVLPHTVCHLWYPSGAVVGLLLRLHLFLPHLGCHALHQELPDWNPVSESNLLALHPHVLRPLLWGTGESVQQHTSGTSQGGVGVTKTMFTMSAREIGCSFGFVLFL